MRGKMALISTSATPCCKRANRSLCKLKTYLGRVIGESSGMKILWEAFAQPLFLARRVLEQECRQRGHSP
jgi:hypothetical protein